MLVAVGPGHGVAAATASASAVKYEELTRLILQLREAYREAGEGGAGLPARSRRGTAARALVRLTQDVTSAGHHLLMAHGVSAMGCVCRQYPTPRLCLAELSECRCRAISGALGSR